LKGDEPFWKAELANGRLSYTNFETGKTKELDVVIYTAKRGMNPRFYFMFKALDGSVWGVVNYKGWNPRDQQICECDISDEISLYETYIFMDGEIWRGCVSIESNNHIISQS
jgi:uncharacterized membrane protein